MASGPEGTPPGNPPAKLCLPVPLLGKPAAWCLSGRGVSGRKTLTTLSPDWIPTAATFGPSAGTVSKLSPLAACAQGPRALTVLGLATSILSAQRQDLSHFPSLAPFWVSEHEGLLHEERVCPARPGPAQWCPRDKSHSVQRARRFPQITLTVSLCPASSRKGSDPAPGRLILESLQPSSALHRLQPPASHRCSAWRKRRAGASKSLVHIRSVATPSKETTGRRCRLRCWAVPPPPPRGTVCNRSLVFQTRMVALPLPWCVRPPIKTRLQERQSLEEPGHIQAPGLSSWGEQDSHKVGAGPPRARLDTGTQAVRRVVATSHLPPTWPSHKALL